MLGPPPPAYGGYPPPAYACRVPAIRHPLRAMVVAIRLPRPATAHRVCGARLRPAPRNEGELRPTSVYAERRPAVYTERRQPNVYAERRLTNVNAYAAEGPPRPPAAIPRVGSGRCVVNLGNGRWAACN